MGRRWVAAAFGTCCLCATGVAPADAPSKAEPGTGAQGTVHCDQLLEQGRTLAAQLQSCLSADGAELQACLFTASELVSCGREFERQLGRSILDEGATQTLQYALGNSVGSSQDKSRSQKRLAEFRAAAARKALRFSLVSQGGISLGSWQAGFALVLTEWVKRIRSEGAEPGRSRAQRGFHAITGASAGAVNGLAVALASCRQDTPTPTESLGYRVWVESLGLTGRHGYPGLWSAEDPPDHALALLDDRAIREVAMQHTRDELDRRFAPGCSVDFGFAVTPLGVQTKDVHLEDRRNQGAPVSVIRRSSLREKFAITLSTDGDGRLQVRNVQLPASRAEQKHFFAQLGLQPKGEPIDREVVLRAVQASGAFPGAFPPVRLPYVEHRATKEEATHVAAFVDGGTFDNTPVGLAIDLNTWQQELELNEARIPLADNPFLKDVFGSLPTNYYFLEPNVTAWANQTTEVPEDSVATEDILQTMLRFAGNFAASSFDAEFLDNARRNPFILQTKADWSGPRLVVPERQLPIAGEQLAHFLAFFEHDFRVYDFYVGMADARHFLDREERQLAIKDASLSPLNELHAGFQEDARYRCITQYYDALAKGDLAGQREPVEDGATTAETQARPQELQAIDRQDALSGPAALPPSCAELWHGGTTTEADVALFRREVQRTLNQTHRQTFDADLASPVSTSNFAGMLAAMHNYRRWLTRERPASVSFSKFISALNGDPLDGSRFTRAQWFHFVDLKNVASAEDAIEVVWDVLHGAVQNLAENQDSELTPHVLRIAERPALDALFDTKTWPRATLGLGLSRGVEVYGGWRIKNRLRGDLGARMLSFVPPPGQPKSVDESISGSELYVRLLWQDLIPFGSSLGLDPYLRFGVGCLDLTDCRQGATGGPFFSPGIGVRVSALDRLSVGAEFQRPWRLGQHALREAWSQVPLALTFQFLW